MGRCVKGVTAVGAAVAVLVASGCAGEEAEPRATAAGSATGTPAATSTKAPSSPTTTPSPAVSVEVPAAAQAKTDAGAKAFAAHFTREMDLAATRADATTLRALSDPSCQGCSAAIGLVEALRAGGRRHAEPSLSVDGTRIVSSTDAQRVVEVLVSDSGSQTIDRSGAVVAESGAAKFTMRHSLAWRQGEWIVIRSVIVQ